MAKRPNKKSMKAFHLGACANPDDSAPAGDDCHADCPRRLYAKVAFWKDMHDELVHRKRVAQAMSQHYRDALKAIANYDGSSGLGCESIKAIAADALENGYEKVRAEL